jgi:hypothetical protein
MDRIKEQCCTGDGRADFDKIRRFMERGGKFDFSDGDIDRMQTFCDQPGTADGAKLKQLLVSCGCQIPESAAEV